MMTITILFSSFIFLPIFSREYILSSPSISSSLPHSFSELGQPTATLTTTVLKQVVSHLPRAKPSGGLCTVFIEGSLFTASDPGPSSFWTTLFLLICWLLSTPCPQLHPFPSLWLLASPVTVDFCLWSAQPCQGILLSQHLELASPLRKFGYHWPFCKRVTSERQGGALTQISE